jgi:hypothetical protein
MEQSLRPLGGMKKTANQSTDKDLDIYNIKGTSMLPFLTEGDKVVATSTFDIEGLKRFDVLLIDFKGELFCHYFWESFIDFRSKGTLIRTRPLNPIEEYDYPVPPSCIKAKVLKRRIPLLKKLHVYIRTFFSKES